MYKQIQTDFLITTFSYTRITYKEKQSLYRISSTISTYLTRPIFSVVDNIKEIIEHKYSNRIT